LCFDRERHAAFEPEGLLSIRASMRTKSLLSWNPSSSKILFTLSSCFALKNTITFTALVFFKFFLSWVFFASLNSTIALFLLPFEILKSAGPLPSLASRVTSDVSSHVDVFLALNWLTVYVKQLVPTFVFDDVLQELHAFPRLAASISAARAPYAVRRALRRSCFTE
jgi:hypothetical protein